MRDMSTLTGKENIEHKIRNNFCIPALMYHHVSPDIRTMISIPPELFKAQLSALYEKDWRAISVRTALDCLASESSPPEKAC